ALGSCRFQPTRGGSLRLRAPGTTLWISTGKGARLRASAEVVPAPPRGLARLAGEAGRAPAGLDHPSLLVLAAGETGLAFEDLAPALALQHLDGHGRAVAARAADDELRAGGHRLAEGGHELGVRLAALRREEEEGDVDGPARMGRAVFLGRAHVHVDVALALHQIVGFLGGNESRHSVLLHSLSMSRSQTWSETPSPSRRRASSRTTATLRCLPPVQPIAMVR